MRNCRTILLLALLGAGIPIAENAAASTPIDGQVAKPQSYDVLRERVRVTSLLETSDPKFPEMLIIASRHGGELFVSTITYDPLDPDTLDLHFDNWNLSARASLLLDYARIMAESDKPHSYAGFDEQMRRLMQLHDVETRARVTQIVLAGGYAVEWQPFVVAYRKFIVAAESALPPGDTDSGALEVAKAIGRVAKSQGLYQLVRELRVDPSDVTNEMLRGLGEARSRMGAPSGATEHGANLLYTCIAEPTPTIPIPQTSTAAGRVPKLPRARLNVNVHTWHSLAPAFFRAWEAADKQKADLEATLIMASFQRVSDDINSWAVEHPGADSIALDLELNQMATKSGLIALLDQYAAQGAPKLSSSP